jgi:hypothetical protein
VSDDLVAVESQEVTVATAQWRSMSIRHAAEAPAASLHPESRG